MKTYFRSCLCISLLLSAGFVGARNKSDDCDDINQNRARSTITQHPHHDLLEHQNHYRNYVYGMDDCFSLDFNFTYQFDHTFSEDENITCALFGRAAQPGTGSSSSSQNCDDDRSCQSILLQGSGVNNRNQNALRAEEFGLGADTNTSVSFDPQIQNHMFNFQLHANLGEILEGLYAQVDLPLVHTEWKLRDDSNCTPSSSSSSSAGTQQFVSGCIDAFDGTNDAPVSSVNAALAGQTNFGDKTTNLQWDRIVFNEKDDTELANLTFSLGYNFIECPSYHMAGYLYYAAPTATEIGQSQDHKDELFAPVVGSNHHELGGGLVGHMELYSWDDEHTLTAFMQGYAAYSFDECSRRTFDLDKQGELSRYMLLKEFDSNNNYTGNLIPAANFTNRLVETNIDIKGEGILELMYSNACGLDISLGFGIWGQDDEDINCDCENLRAGQLDDRNLGVKGLTPVSGISFTRANDGDAQTDSDGTDNGLYNATQSQASMFSAPTQNADNTAALRGRPYAVVDNNQSGFLNDLQGNVTNPCLDERLIQNRDTIANFSLLQNTSGPKYLNKEDINLNSGLIPSMISYRFFGRANYVFEDVDFMPYIGVGASVEFSDSDHPATPERAAVFLNGGISF